MTSLHAADQLMTVEDYLATEPLSPVRREYLGGVVYAMAGANTPHNTISANLGGILYNQFLGKPCQNFGSDMRLKLRLNSTTLFYYPDAIICCDPTDNASAWSERPAVIFEILSDSTRQIDEREKRNAYIQIQSLQAYVRIHQDAPRVTVDHRDDDSWKIEHLTGLDAILRLPPVKLDIPLAELYARLKFDS